MMDTTYRSFFINACIGFGKLSLAMYYGSLWMAITAMYYLTLGIIRRYLILVNNKENRKEYSLYHKSGYLISIISIVYLGLCIWMYCFNEQISYPPYILYGVAAIGFYKIIIASIGLIKIRKKHHLLVSSILVINLFDACVSIVFIQCALLISKKSMYASSSSAILGMVVSILFIGIGIYMVYRKDKESIIY